MAFRLTIGVLVGIIFGGVFLLCAIVITLVVLYLRSNHRRLLARTDASGERRLTRFPRSHMSITDEDVARMPGNNAAVRRSLDPRYNRASLYTPMALRDSLRPPQDLESYPRATLSDRASNESLSTHQGWPLPRRLTRADGTPSAKIAPPSLSPVTRKKANYSRRSPDSKATREPIKTPQEANPSTKEVGEPFRYRRDDANTSPYTNLKPRPLFHGQQRSISHGILSHLAEGNKAVAELYVLESKDPKALPLLPRSRSLYDQEPGLAPKQPIPPLPFDVTPKHFPRIKSPADKSAKRESGGSLLSQIFSENTSVFDDQISRAFSQAETDFTSLSLVSPPVATSTPTRLGIHEGSRAMWDSSDIEGRSSPVAGGKPIAFRPRLNTQKSFRASIQNSLPRSTSSGLSLNMSLHGPSRVQSSEFPSRDQSKSSLKTSRSTEKRSPRRDMSPVSAVSRGHEFVVIHEDRRNKRTSASVLQRISGNEGRSVSSNWDRRPASFATENSFQLDHLEAIQGLKPLSPKDKANRHQRQTSMRLSNILAFPPSPEKSQVVEEKGGRSQETANPKSISRETRKKPTTFRPPSCQQFDPQIASTPRRQNSRVVNHSPFSPTLAMMKLYREDDEGVDFEIDTPTRNPSSRKTAGAHPNRRKTIFDNHEMAAWSLPNPPRSEVATITEPQKSNIFNHLAEIQDQKSSSHSRPTCFLPNKPFPVPPSDLDLSLASFPVAPSASSWRDPKTPIRRIAGPRTPPFRYISPGRRRSPLKGVGKLRSSSPSKDLRWSVAALRRMNSEVNEGRGSKEHKRYLSIGESEGHAILEDEGESGNVGGEVDVGKGRTSSKEIGKEGGFGKSNMPESPTGSIYDTDGFLKEFGFKAGLL